MTRFAKVEPEVVYVTLLALICTLSKALAACVAFGYTALNGDMRCMLHSCMFSRCHYASLIKLCGSLLNVTRDTAIQSRIAYTDCLFDSVLYSCGRPGAVVLSFYCGFVHRCCLARLWHAV